MQDRSKLLLDVATAALFPRKSIEYIPAIFLIRKVCGLATHSAYTSMHQYYRGQWKAERFEIKRDPIVWRNLSVLIRIRTVIVLRVWCTILMSIVDYTEANNSGFQPDVSSHCVFV